MSIYATNPKAHFDYQIIETFEAGLSLAGQEVKSIKNGKVSLKGAYVKILNGEAWLLGAIVSPYQANNVPPDYDQQRNRKLLLKKSELQYLQTKSQEQGLTLVPIKVYSKKNLIKLEIGLARGKKKYDKREAIKKKEFERRGL
ncbi:MAG: SsrA-binding protein [Candidatus Yanofskybacteria bacterium RIFCSPHIGHO2_02_FULL_43_15c]|uniref:SsrA-binding protein n=2 Tax=Candidatus Yanofskyibacteriota TaxID=1752733 RepID=A0A1F8H3W0_9BACT|nr:MAG: SsrA-binding protein [Candidatus Yanofskybacteria bacterium RIFCSPHIGHO2_02_FULL_43_15c]OGN32265.1 MAG: SsrA-binding protein [Candidatus Yanofskybacteria bacterium RIFCSPLOWO2_02_FULL_43_10b]